MPEHPHMYWFIFAGVLIFAEFLLPGLVSVFVGLGAATVGVLLYLGHVESLPAQFIWFFGSSILYIFTLRILVIRFYPSDTDRQDTDEDAAVFGEIATVVEDFDASGNGRITHSGSTWVAKSERGSTPRKGERVKIVGRENITWLVKKV